MTLTFLGLFHAGHWVHAGKVYFGDLVKERPPGFHELIVEGIEGTVGSYQVQDFMVYNPAEGHVELMTGSIQGLLGSIFSC